MESLTDQIKRAKARWLNRVMQHPWVTSTQKCLAYAIANRLNCVTRDCWASQETLARDIGNKSIKTVVRAGRTLAEFKLIMLQRRKGLRYAPVFSDEDLAIPVSKRGHAGANSVDTDGGESSLSIQSKSSSTGIAPVGGCVPHRNFDPRQRGAIEIKLAEMLGGMDVLARLAAIDEAVIDRLCQAYADGVLSERDLAAARLAAQQS